MKDLKKLRADREAAKRAGKAAVDKLNALLGKGDQISAEEQAEAEAVDAEVDKLEATVTALDAEIAAEEKKARRAGLFSSTAMPQQRATTGFSSQEPNPETTGGFRSIAEFAHAVRNASLNLGMDPRLGASLPANFNQNGGSAGEGFQVPPEYRDTVWSLVFSAGDLIGAVAPEPTNSNVVSIPKDETTPWGSTGVQSNWRTEASQMSASKAVTGNVLVPLHELYAFVVATDELLSDAPRLQNRLGVKAADAIRWKASDAIAWGDGVGKPLGFMNSGALVSVAKESGQAADTIVAANVAKMFSRLLPGNISGAFWLANPDTLPQLMTMTIGDQPIWTPPNSGFAQAPGGFLLGRPIMLSEHGATVGDLGDLVLMDPMGYYAATKAGGGVDFASSIHLFFDYGAQAFRWTFRMGGQPYLSAPISPARGSATKSHFVGLAARA